MYYSDGNFIKNIGNNDEYRYYIDSFVLYKKKYLIVGGNKGIQVFNYFNTINIWDFINKKLISKINSDTNCYLYGFVIINSKYLFIGSNKGIKEFDIENKAHAKNTNKHISTVVGLKPVKDKNNKTYIISYGQDKKIFLWDFK